MEESRSDLADALDGVLEDLSRARRAFLLALENEAVPKPVRDEIVARLSGAEVDLRRGVATARGLRTEYDDELDRLRERAKARSEREYKNLERLGSFV